MSSRYQPVESGDVPISALLDVLARERRRIALRYLIERGELVTVDELIEHVVEAEPATGRETDPERVRASFHHAHLPKLAEAGVIAYDRDQGWVEATAVAEEATPLLDLARQRSEE